MEQKLLDLKLKKAKLWEQIESLQEVSPKLFQEFGKTQAEIMKLKKIIINQTKNPIDE